MTEHPWTLDQRQHASHDARRTWTSRLTSRTDLQVAVGQAQRLPMLADASAVDRSIIATMLSELGSNILKYAGRGQLSMTRHDHTHGVDIRIDAQDNGPGIADIDMAMRDHVSTGGTLGLGLPGVRRMADSFHIESVPARGTRVSALKCIRGRCAADSDRSLTVALAGSRSLVDAEAMPRWELGVHLRPCSGHVVSGDLALAMDAPDSVLLGVVDISGHGRGAHGLASEVESVLRASSNQDPVALLAALHQGLRGSVGAAAGLARIDKRTGDFQYAGVGNVRAVKIGDRSWHGITRDGVLGERLPSPLLQHGRMQRGDVLLLCSDGVAESPSRDALGGAFRYLSASELARRMVEDFGRSYDDASCAVMKWLA